MRVKTLGIVCWAAALACGRGERAAPPAEQPPRATPAVSGTVVDVRMTGNGRDRAAFEPARLAIAPGTTLRFINVSGGPHNIVFWADSIPAGATAGLNAALPGRQGNLASPYVVQPNGTYEITFPATLPTGAYKAFCAPHLLMGMVMEITLQ